MLSMQRLIWEMTQEDRRTDERLDNPIMNLFSAFLKISRNTVWGSDPQSMAAR
jgi:hypothetical protein